MFKISINLTENHRGTLYCAPLQSCKAVPHMDDMGILLSVGAALV